MGRFPTPGVIRPILVVGDKDDQRAASRWAAAVLYGEPRNLIERLIGRRRGFAAMPDSLGT